MYLPLRPISQVGHHPDYIGDHLTRPLDNHRVTHFDVFLYDEVFIMQRNRGDGHTGKAYRLYFGYGGDSTRPAYLVLYINKLGLCLLRRKFICYGPARMMRCGATLLLHLQVIYLDDHTIRFYFVGQSFSLPFFQEW